MANAFLKTLGKMPQGSLIGGSIAVTCALSAFCLAFFGRNGERVSTLSPEWRAANKTYMIQFDMNPISGISRGKSSA
jgi:hypothetical protein